MSGNETGSHKIERHIKHIPGIKFTVVADVYEAHVDFSIYDIEGWVEGATKGVFDVPAWHRAGTDSYPNLVESLEEAALYLHGSVKWDGCSNWHFDEQDGGMLHGCSKADLQRFGDVMATCWDWAAELCSTWDA